MRWLVGLVIAVVVWTSAAWSDPALAEANGSERAPGSATATYYRYDETTIGSLAARPTELRTTFGELEQQDAAMFDLVKLHRVPPTVAAKVFAYVLSAQADAAALSRTAHGEYVGSFAPLTAKVLCVFFRSECANLSRDLARDAYSAFLAEVIFAKVQERIQAENDRTRPYPRKHGDQFWWAEWPTTPYAGAWMPWLIKSGSRFRAGPPPVYGSPEDMREIAAVKHAIARRSPEQQRAVLYWAGVPGTETPAGIWLRLANDHLTAASVSLERAFLARSTLAMAMADAFIACWDTKYFYWTKRPIMRDPSIRSSIDTPTFPSYTSGHATVSAAAALVLGHYFPAAAARWMTLAEEARDSRLWSGIHFPIDNARGFAMGKAIASEILERRPAASIER